MRQKFFLMILDIHFDLINGLEFYETLPAAIKRLLRIGRNMN